MKILWVEDFGGRLLPGPVVEEIFGDFFKHVDLGEEYNPDNPDVAGQLSGLFAKHTLHEIQLCKSYAEWKEVDAKHRGDFDIALIDINLDANPTPNEAIPEGIRNSEFDRKAGLCIYHKLIKQGFTEDNIAFFTGESQSVADFLRHCDEIMLNAPKHVFEKSPLQFRRVREWIRQKANERTRIADIKVLLVDDEKEVLDRLASQLRRNAYEVTTAENGQEALLLAQDNEFDVIITDVNLPILGGFDFIARLPKRDPPIRVIVLDAFGSRHALKALNLNVFAYIEKGSIRSAPTLLRYVEKATWEKTKAVKGRKLRVFLCHAAEDKRTVRKLHTRLRNEGFNPWFDKEKLLPGQEWEQEILTAVKSTDVIIICLSQASLNKEGYVQKEIRYALELADEKPQGTIFLIPLRLERCEIPRALRRWHSADVFEEEEEEWNRLLSSLRLRAGSLGLLGT